MSPLVVTRGKTEIVNIKHRLGDIIANRFGLSLQITASGSYPVGQFGLTERKYEVLCSRCGHKFLPTKHSSLVGRKSCPGCEERPAALKKDTKGSCITICRMGQLEHIHKLITEEGLTQQEAAESFIESVQAHSDDGDPLTSRLTVEMIRSQYRRDSGKLNGKSTDSLVEVTKGSKKNTEEDPQQNPKLKKYQCAECGSSKIIFL